MGILSIINKVIRALAGVALLAYLGAWILALVGLAGGQRWCSGFAEKEDASERFTAGNIGGNWSSQVGNNCSKLLRFPWTVWALGTLPILLFIIDKIKPQFVPRGSSGLWSVITVLFILMCNDFYNASDSANEARELGAGPDELNSGDWHDIKQWWNIALAGFAGMAAFALLIIITEAMINPQEGKDKQEEHHTGGYEGGTYSNKRDVDYNRNEKRRSGSFDRGTTREAAPTQARPIGTDGHYQQGRAVPNTGGDRDRVVAVPVVPARGEPAVLAENREGHVHAANDAAAINRQGNRY